MKILNKNNLPEALVRAAKGDGDHTPSETRMSVTDLIGSPWMRHMKMIHYKDVSVEVEDMTWLMFGNAFHAMMNKYAPEDATSEIRIELDVNGYTLVGIPDVHKDGILDDFKTTSVYSFLLGEKVEWERQLNVYVWMLRQKGIEIKQIRIIAILRDWMQRKTIEDNYPKKPLIAVDIPLWDNETAETYIRERIEAHKLLTPCTPEERWRKPTTYAVKVKGIKTAKRVLPTKEEAEEWLASNSLKFKVPTYIEERPGEDSKCLNYCNYAKWCTYNIYQEEK